MKTKNLPIFYFLIFSIFYFLFSVFYAKAIYSELYFEDPGDSLVVGQEFEVKLMLSTDQPLNAYAIKFLYPKNVIELVGFNNSNSIIDIWQTQPQVSQNGDVLLKGGSTKPHISGSGLIITAKFKALSQGSGEIIFGDSNVYLANGKGTEVTPGVKNLTLNIAERSGGVALKESGVDDDLPPNIEALSVIKNPINSDQKLLSFIVKDDSSGIEEVYYRTMRWLWWSKSQPALNPTAFSSNVWSVDFEVIDNQGNVSRKTIYDWPVFLKRVFPVAIFLLIAFWLVISMIIKRKKL